MASSAGGEAPEAASPPADSRPRPPPCDYKRLPAERLRRIHQARQVRRAVARRVEERQRRLRALRLRDSEDGGADRPEVRRLEACLRRGGGRRRPGEGT